MQIINTSQRECGSLKPPVAFSTEREVTQRRGRPLSSGSLGCSHSWDAGRLHASGPLHASSSFPEQPPCAYRGSRLPAHPVLPSPDSFFGAEGGYHVLHQAPGPRQTVRGRCPSSRIVPTSCAKGPNNRFLFSLPSALGDKSMV